MTRANGDGKQHMLNELCEIIIDELKSFSSSHRTISQSTLLEALSAKAEVLRSIASREHVLELKGSCVKILSEIANCSNSDCKDLSEELSECVYDCQSLDEIYLLLDRVVELVTKSASDSYTKEKSLAQLLIEVGTQLGEVERECLGLIESGESVHLGNSMFTTLIESEITKLEISAESAQDVSEVREILQNRLKTIKSAIEAKKAEDSLKKRTFESAIENFQNNLQKMQSRIERDRKRTKHLEQEALYDPLTGISNRRVMERHIRKGIRKYKREKTPFSLVFIDIDDFKTINDTYGHRVGDKCLQSLVARMKQILRESDLIGRYGGDEFVVFLEATDQRAARVVADKLSSAISKTCFMYKDSEIQISVSIGLTQVEDGDTNPEKIIERADSALYFAKNQGKDCIIVT